MKQENKRTKANLKGESRQIILNINQENGTAKDSEHCNHSC